MPEKSIREISRAVKDQYEKGLMAIQRDNLDYALQILSGALKLEPGFYECREALRSAQLKKASKKGGFFKKLLGSASGSPLLAKGQVQLRTNPVEAIATAEQVLNVDPNSVAAHKLLADAALAVDLPRTAVLSLEIAFRNNPDRNVALKLGEALAVAGDASRAEAMMSELAKTLPGDVEVQQVLKNVCANRTMRQGYEGLANGQGSYRDVLRDEKEAVALEQEQKSVKSSDVSDQMIRDYEGRLGQEPQNIRLHRSLAALYTERHLFDRALAVYEKLTGIEGVADPSLETLMIETGLKKYDFQIEQLDPGSDDYAEQLKDLESGRKDYELSAWQRLTERYPNNHEMRFQVGKLLMKAGAVNEAIQAFQKAQANPHLHTQALHFLGLCFAKKGIHDLAARTLQNALKDKVVFDDEKMEIVYALGEVLEAMGKGDEAIEQFKSIYEIDIDYRDVAGKIDTYYAQQ